MITPICLLRASTNSAPSHVVRYHRYAYNITPKLCTCLVKSLRITDDIAQHELLSDNKRARFTLAEEHGSNCMNMHSTRVLCDVLLHCRYGNQSGGGFGAAPKAEPGPSKDPEPASA
jgi:hypothetical protein